MRTATLASLAALAVMAATVAARGSPTLVELFTSEGCNSCPPADDYLRKLAAASQEPGDENILIAWHVDYWDRLGWKDPYGLAIATQRQRDYAAAMERRGGDAGRPGVYTPQMIVAGRRAFVGSDERAGAFALGPRHRGAAQRLEIESSIDGDALTLTATLPRLPDGATVMGVLVEDGLSSAVTAGENKGKTLTHDRVARAAAVGRVVGDAATIELAIPPGVVRENASVVVFAQAADMGAVLAVGNARLLQRSPDRYRTLAFGRNTLRYALILPDDFDPRFAYPAMIALPPGAQNEAMVEAGLGRYWEAEGKRRRWIVASPINPEGSRFFEHAGDPIGALMDELNERFNIERDRFHLTGVSNGGRVAFVAAMEHPGRVASVTVLPGQMIPRTRTQNVRNLRGVAVTLYVGADDDAWVRAAQRTKDELELHGLSATLHVLEGQGHGLDIPPKTLFDLLESNRR